ncbi:MAG TPA: asparaginase [Gemmatimonadales bacterium]|nr:asparaginase [Gemmatimonadales bacterium]
MIHLLFTGGTISMRRDARAGGNVPAHGGAALVGFAPELERVAPFRIEDWGKYPACHLGPDRLFALRNRVRDLVSGAGEGGDRVRGVVLTHGTDTIEETAYLLARTVTPEVPVVLTGAMRTADTAGWDGPRNLTDAARVAAHPDSRGRGTMVVFAGQIFAGHQAVKTEAVGLDAFSAPHGGPIGEVRGQEVRFFRSPRPPPTLDPPHLEARVALIPAVIGDQGALLDLARPSHDGVVLVAFGSGNVPPGMVPAIRRWLGEGKPVVLASRCLTGEVTPVYAFPGGGATLVRDGAIPAGPRTASQARIELVISLSAGVRYGGGEP